MRRPPGRTHGILPDVRQLNNVRRLIGNRASNCFWLMKPASPADVWLFSARMPISVTPALAGGAILKKSLRSPFMQRKLYMNHGRRRCITYTFQLRALCSRRHRKCPLHLSSAFTNRANWRKLHPSLADIHTPENCLKFTGQALPLRQRRFWCPRNSRGEITICPAKWPRRCPQPRSVRVQSTGTINPRPGHVRVQSMTASASAVFPSARTLQIRAQSVSLGSPRPRSGREPAVSRNLDRPGNVRAAASSFPV